MGIAHQAIPNGDKVSQDRWSCARRHGIVSGEAAWRELEAAATWALP